MCPEGLGIAVVVEELGIVQVTVNM